KSGSRHGRAPSSQRSPAHHPRPGGVRGHGDSLFQTAAKIVSPLRYVVDRTHHAARAFVRADQPAGGSDDGGGTGGRGEGPAKQGVPPGFDVDAGTGVQGDHDVFGRGDQPRRGGGGDQTGNPQIRQAAAFLVSPDS